MDEQPPGDPTPPGAAADPAAVTSVWDDVIADMEATAEEYREEGFSTLELHPGDVALAEGREGGRWGLDLLVPDDEFDELESLVSAHEFAESQVYRADEGGLVLLVVAMLDEEGQAAVLFPAYYDAARAGGVLDRVRAEGELRTHLRPLDQRTIVTFRHEEPDLFLPAGDD